MAQVWPDLLLCLSDSSACWSCSTHGSARQSLGFLASLMSWVKAWQDLNTGISFVLFSTFDDSGSARVWTAAAATQLRALLMLFIGWHMGV